MRGTKIARGLARAHDKLRSIYLEGSCLKLYAGDQQALGTATTYTTGWYLDKREYSEMQGDGSRKYFKRLVIDDLEGCRRQVLENATVAQVDDRLYKFGKKDSMIGSVPSYEFKVYPTGERV